MEKSSLVLFCLLPLLGSGCSDGTGREEPGPPPNIVFVLLDAARADHFSGYGYPRPTTPEIDRIGEKGAVFLNTFVPATETFAVMPLIMSSRYFSRPIFQMDTWGWGVRRETPETIFQDFDDGQILLPEFLTGIGYRTAIFRNHPWFADPTDFVRAFDESYFFPTSIKKPVDGDMVSAVLEWVGIHSSEPFFVYYHVMSPHQPYPPKAEDSLFINPGEEEALAAAREKFEGPGGSSAGNWSEEEIQYFRALYDSNLAHSDRWVGRLYEGLEELGLAEDTIFIVTSDHGTLLGEHGRLTYGCFPPWDAIIKVPLIMVWPGQIPARVRVKGLTEAVDIFPTICDLAGLELPPGKRLDGISLRRLFFNPAGGKEAIYVKNAVRTKNYKYMIDKDLFFDLIEDPGETRNISDQIPDDFKEELKQDYERDKEPFRERYLQAVLRSPPPEPFYFPVNVFTITPSSGYRKFGSEKFPSHLLAGSPPEKAWHLNTLDRRGYLICSPGEKAPPPLNLASPLPDGDYLVSLLIAPLNGRPFSPDGKEFRARFQDSGPFISPISVREFSIDDEGPFYYLDYGRVLVQAGSFSIELNFQPSPMAAFIIHYLQFSPPAAPAPAPKGKAELREMIKSLKELGYDW